MPGPRYWTQTPRNRILTAPAVIGKGTYPLWYSADMIARAAAAGVSVPANIQTDWNENPDVRVKPITHRAWNDFKDLCDDVRSAENADPFNWTTPIDGTYAGPLTYRNEVAAAWERWDTNVSRGRWLKSDLGITWEEACQNTEDDEVIRHEPQEAMFLYGNRLGGSEYLCHVERNFSSTITTGYDPDDYPDAASTAILEFQIDYRRDDWSRAWAMDIWSATGTGWDDQDELIVSLDKSLLSDGTWIFVDVSGYVTLGVVSYFLMKLDHDNTTIDGSGTFSHPPAPLEIEPLYLEGVRFKTPVPKLYSYVDDVADIGPTA